jgi:hypothetical protein
MFKGSIGYIHVVVFPPSFWRWDIEVPFIIFAFTDVTSNLNFRDTVTCLLALLEQPTGWSWNFILVACNFEMNSEALRKPSSHWSENSTQIRRESRYYNVKNILSRVGVTIKRRFGLGDWIYWPLIHSYTWGLRQYSAIADLHTFTIHRYTRSSRILATDSSQSHWHFRAHVKSSCHSLIPFLAISSQ